MTMHAVGSAIPHALKVEHETLFYQLDKARSKPGRLGQAAKALAEALQPHMAAEETYALPPLAVLHGIANGEVPAEASSVIMMAERLRQELPTMHQEHRALGLLARELADAAQDAGDTEIETFTDALMLHSELEEQILYPAAILAGMVLRLKLRR